MIRICRIIIIKSQSIVKKKEIKQKEAFERFELNEFFKANKSSLIMCLCNRLKSNKDEIIYIYIYISVRSQFR
jgi:hypothetical protein